MLRPKRNERGDRRCNGYSLVEIIFVLSILAGLAALGTASHRSTVLRAHRVEARAVLLDLAAAQERHYLQNGTYATAEQLTTAPPDGLGLAPISDSGRFILTLAADASGFVATAAATGPQSNDLECAELKIDAYGVRSATSFAGAPTDGCWE